MWICVLNDVANLSRGVNSDGHAAVHLRIVPIHLREKKNFLHQISARRVADVIGQFYWRWNMSLWKPSQSRDVAGRV